VWLHAPKKFNVVRASSEEKVKHEKHMFLLSSAFQPRGMDKKRVQRGSWRRSNEFLFCLKQEKK